jgi:hypothetical protein
MNEVESLLAEIGDLATERHGEVIRSAFEEASVYCPHCRFAIGQEDFCWTISS